MSRREPSAARTRKKPQPEAAPEWLEPLRREYRRNFPEKLAALARCVDALAEAPSAAKTHAALLLAVHRLHGSAATYGLEDAGEILGAWESQLRLDPPPDGRMAPRSVAEMRRLLRKLQRAPGGTG